MWYKEIIDAESIALEDDVIERANDLYAYSIRNNKEPLTLEELEEAILHEFGFSYDLNDIYEHTIVEKKELDTILNKVVGGYTPILDKGYNDA